MSILKYIGNNQRHSLEEMYKYLVDPNKTDYRGMFGLLVNPAFAVEEMQLVQNIYHYHPRVGRKTYQHIIFSFDVGIGLPIEQLVTILIEIGKVISVDERQILGTVHYLNTEKIHCHYMMNYIGINGEVYRQQYSLRYYKDEINSILVKWGLTPIKYYEGFSQVLNVA